VARDQDEVSVALVLENQSLKAITGLGYRWTAIDELGERRIQVGFHDSYLMDVHQAVVEPGFASPDHPIWNVGRGSD
jgi:hypothetical protein